MSQPLQNAGRQAVINAIRNQDVAGVRRELKKKRVPIDAVLFPETGGGALHFACMQGNPDIVKLIVLAGANIDLH